MFLSHVSLAFVISPTRPMSSNPFPEHDLSHTGQPNIQNMVDVKFQLYVALAKLCARTKKE